MSMDNPDDFEQLRRLLALKRHERPHPRYFNTFSQQVIARIKAGEAGADVALLPPALVRAPWFQRLWAAFETKPWFAGSVGFAACAMLMAGVVLSGPDDSAQLNLPQGMDPVLVQLAERPGVRPVVERNLLGLDASSIRGGASQPQGALFDIHQPPRFQFVNEARAPF